jgi:hypothetical protein
MSRRLEDCPLHGTNQRLVDLDFINVEVVGGVHLGVIVGIQRGSIRTWEQLQRVSVIGYHFSMYLRGLVEDAISISG